MGQNAKNIIKCKAPNIYETYIVKLLNETNFTTAKVIVRLLKNEFDITDDYARKIIQRGVTNEFFISSNPITFGNRQFAYLKLGEKLTPQIVMQICKKDRPPLYRLMVALNLNNGILSYYEGLKLSAAPEEVTTSKINTLNQLLTILVKLDFVYEKNDINGVKYIIEKNGELEKGGINEAALMANHYRKMIIDCIFILDILKWLKKSNLIDNIQYLYRNKKTPAIGAVQNDLLWDAVAYTKTTGINSILGVDANTIERQTFVPLDIVLHRTYSQVDLDGFYSRIQIVINSVKKTPRKVLPIVIYRNASEEIINSLSKLGFIAFDIASIFGTKIGEVIENLLEIQIGLDIDNGSIDKIVTSTLSTIKTAGQDENLKDLKGVLFEYLLYPVLKTYYPNAEIIHGKTLSEQKPGKMKEYYEYDYIIKSSNPKEIVIVELKGYSSNVYIPVGNSATKNTLGWFFRKTLPFAKRYFKKEINEGAHFAACFITPAKYYDDGHAFIKEISDSNIKPIKLEIAYDGEKLFKLLAGNDFKNINDTICKFYSKYK